MEVQPITALAPLAAPLMRNPEKAIFETDQYRTLQCILEVFLPPVTTTQSGQDALRVTPARYAAIEKELKPFLPPSIQEDEIRNYLEENVMSTPAYHDSIQKRFHYFMPKSVTGGLAFILGALNTRVGALLLTGTTKLLSEMPLSQRTVLIAGWSHARLPLLRAIVNSMSGLAKQTYLPLSATLNKVLDFPSPPKHIERTDSYEFEFKDFSKGTEPISIETDVVIVGSGCGAGVMASNLARAGLKVLVVEKSYHFPATHFPMSTDASGENLMEAGGAIMSDDSSTVVLAGSTWGGGGTVNWSASLQPQDFVREEWASSPNDLDFFESAAFQNCLDTVCSRMGVAKATDHEELSVIKHNFANKTLIEGARKLGMAAETVPQNSAGRDHACGSCCMEGCAAATKQGPANYWLPEAARHGAEVIQGCFVTEITFSDKRATGIKAVWTSSDRKMIRNLIIHAPRVIVSAGTLHSPLLLLRSGLKNPHIGSHLHLHPTSQISAIFPFRTNPWEGNILTSAVTSLEHHNGTNHGPKIECNTSTPTYNLVWMPWNPSLCRTAPYHHSPTTSSSPSEVDDHIAASVIDWKVRAAKFGHSINFISLQRDHGEGKVYMDPDDSSRSRVRISYTPSQRDLEGIFAGLVAAARIAYVQGAIELDHGNPSYTRFYRPKSQPGEDEDVAKRRADDAFEAWIQGWKDVGGVSPKMGMMFGSAHQMGTCRMSRDASRGVVDDHGRVWDREGLWVADASVFPSASGVNPMVTNMGISEWIARGIVKGWREERSVKTK